MTARNLALATPFVVLAAAVGSFTVTPLWIQKRAAEAREPAATAMAGAVRSLGHLVDMRVQMHRWAMSWGASDAAEALHAREALDRSFSTYAADAPAEAKELLAALAAQERVADESGVDPAQLRRSGEHLTQLLMDTLALETARTKAASANLEEVRFRALRISNRFSLCWVLLAVAGGVVAGLLVRRHQRFAAQVRNLEQRRSEELEQFSARVAHDIVSPLSPVALGVQVLARKLADDPQAQEAAKLVRRSLDRVSTIVDELLRFARAGAQPEPDEAADLSRVMDALREEILPDARERGISLTFEPPPRVQVACAEGAVLVVLQNLLRNAIKYIGDGPHKSIVARAAVLGDRVRLSVQDSGPGIPAGMEAKLFEPYVRAPGTRKPGIGLGLATVKRIVEARRGRVGVASTPHEGSNFWVELPLAA